VSLIGENHNDNHLALLDRKIVLATEGFITHKFCEIVLKDRDRLSNENALTICDYIITMKREINPRLTYKRYNTKGLKVPKTEKTNSEGYEQEGYYTFGFKAFAAEKKTHHHIGAKGFNLHI
jgi:cytochrome c